MVSSGFHYDYFLHKIRTFILYCSIVRRLCEEKDKGVEILHIMEYIAIMLVRKIKNYNGVYILQKEVIEDEIILNQEVNKYFKRIHKPKYEKRIVNLSKNLYAFIIVLTILFVLTPILNALKIITIPQINYYIVFIGGGLLVFLFTIVQNKEYMELEIQKKQFYILYLIQRRLEDHLIKGKEFKKNELAELCKHFRWTLHDAISNYRKIHCFKITEEEIYIRQLFIDFNEKLTSNIITKQNLHQVNFVIKLMVFISYQLRIDREVLMDKELFLSLKNKADELFYLLNSTIKTMSVINYKQKKSLFQRITKDFLLLKDKYAFKYVAVVIALIGVYFVINNIMRIPNVGAIMPIITSVTLLWLGNSKSKTKD